MKRKINKDSILDYLEIGVKITIIFFFLALIGFVVYKKEESTNRDKIEEIREEVDSLNEKVMRVDTVYKEKQITLIDHITKYNEKKIEEINDLPNATDAQRDSLWANIFNAKDSLQSGYWYLLDSLTRTESFRNLSMERNLQD